MQTPPNDDNSDSGPDYRRRLIAYTAERSFHPFVDQILDVLADYYPDPQPDRFRLGGTTVAVFYLRKDQFSMTEAIDAAQAAIPVDKVTFEADAPIYLLQLTVN